MTFHFELTNMTKIETGCTPSYTLFTMVDENPHGNPVYWLAVYNEAGKHLVSVPLNRQALSKLLVDTANKIGEM